MEAVQGRHTAMDRGVRHPRRTASIASGATAGLLSILTLISACVIAGLATSSTAGAAALTWNAPVELSGIHQSASLETVSCPSRAECTALGSDSAGAVALTYENGA